VVLRRDGLQAVDRIGPFRRARRRPLDQIRHLVISSYDLLLGPELLAACFETPPLVLARLQPANRLGPLAYDLAARIGALDPDREEPVAVAEEPSSDFAELPTRPARSRILVAERDGGVVLVIPPGGVHGGLLYDLVEGSLTLLYTSLITFGILTGGIGRSSATGLVFLAVILTALGDRSPKLLCTSLIFWILTGAARSPAEWLVFLAVILAAVWLDGCSRVLASLSSASRRVILAVRDQTLRVEITTFFQGTTRQWSRDDLGTITAGEDSLRIEPREGPPFTVRYQPLLTPKAQEAECAWLAFVLRQALALDTIKK
jgi:hypothetical protein